MLWSLAHHVHTAFSPRLVTTLLLWYKAQLRTTFSVFSDMSHKNKIFYTGLVVDTRHLIIQEPEAGKLLPIWVQPYWCIEFQANQDCIVRNCLSQTWKEGTRPVCHDITCSASIRIWVWIPSPYETISMAIHLCNTTIGVKAGRPQGLSG